MKKKVIFHKPCDTVSIEDISSKGVFLAKKNGYYAILSASGEWLSTIDFSVLTSLSGYDDYRSDIDAITKAHNDGCEVYQYDSFYDLCVDYITDFN